MSISITKTIRSNQGDSHGQLSFCQCWLCQMMMMPDDGDESRRGHGNHDDADDPDHACIEEQGQ